MDRESAAKLVLLTATFGPIFRGDYQTIESQCAYLQQNVPDGAGAPTVLKPDLIRRWRREGVSRTKQGDNLHIFCASVKTILGLDEDVDEIVRWIRDDRLTEYEFAKRCGIERVQVDYILAQYDASKHQFFPDASKLYDTRNFQFDRKHDAYGIYRVVRRKTTRGREDKSECLMVIDRLIDDSRDAKGFIFVRMFVPQPEAPRRISEYRGMLLQPFSHKYFFLESVGTDLPDFVNIITDVGGVPTTELKGVYTSVNIQGSPTPEVRNVILNRITADITDDLVERYVGEVLLKGKPGD